MPFRNRQAENLSNEFFQILETRAKWMRLNPTPAEALLWEHLKRTRNDANAPYFRRQHIFAPYIVDFVCLPARLIVEVDGGVHINQNEYDEGRQLVLEHLDYQLVRFTNEDVIERIEVVAASIKRLATRLD